LLEYKALAGVNGMVLNDIKLYTGRHHQIRVQMAYHKMPLIGDSKYNAGCKQGDVMLYSYSLEFKHPISSKNMLFKHIPTHGEFASFKDVFKN
jgi:23S rRNA pseudouridine1911/1915/1917 synthase